MSDEAIQAAKRTGGGVIQRWRRDEIPAYTVARDVACYPPCPDQYGCALCGGTGRVPFNPQDVLRALAYLGVEEARELMAEEPFVVCAELVPLDLGLKELSRLLAKLPPHRLEVVCANCRHGVVSLGPRCRRCRAHDTPAKDWLLADATLAVARACVPNFECGSCAGCNTSSGQCDYRTNILKALDAGRAWVAEPTVDLWHSWGEAWASAMHAAGAPAWAPYGGFWVELPKVLQSAATVIGAARVRVIITSALLGRLL